VGLGIKYNASNEPKWSSGSGVVEHVIKGGKHAHWIGVAETFS
jgi:hypothetical protein